MYVCVAIHAVLMHGHRACTVAGTRRGTLDIGRWNLPKPCTSCMMSCGLCSCCVDGGYYCGTSSAALHLAQRDRRDNELMPTTMYTKCGDAPDGRSPPGPTFEQRCTCPNSLMRLLSKYDVSRDDRAFASTTISIQDPVKQCSSNLLVGFSVMPM